MKKALIVGIKGQDGYYLSRFLKHKNYKVGAIVQPGSNVQENDLGLPIAALSVFNGNLLEQESLNSVLMEFRPDEVYNLGAQSVVTRSWDDPVGSSDVNALGVARVLEAIRKINPKICYYQASSSEIFGHSLDGLRNEESPFKPDNPYGISKTFGHQLTIAYRERYNLFACSGILFNHESPKRGITYVSRQITRGVAAIKLGIKKELQIGNLEAQRDWGDARDYVRAMWLMLQHRQPGDYVVGSGNLRSVKYLVECAFESAGIKNWEHMVVVKKSLFRARGDRQIAADPSKVRTTLGWLPEIPIEKTIQDMVQNDLDELAREH